MLDFGQEGFLRPFWASAPALAHDTVISAISRNSETLAALGLSGGLSRKSETSIAAFAMRLSSLAGALPSLLT